MGILLAGGVGSRMAELGPKPAVPLAGRPLMAWPLRALEAVCARVAVVCKVGTHLPPLPNEIERWDEPAEPLHPLTGIVFALERAQAGVLVCAADMPFVDAGALRALVAAAEEAPDAVAVVAHAGGRLEPALGLYRHAALRQLGDAVTDAPLRHTVEGLEPLRVALAPDIVRSVNTPMELAAAETELAGPGIGGAVVWRRGRPPRWGGR